MPSRLLHLLLLLCFVQSAFSQQKYDHLFRDCGVTGSTTIYLYKTKKWLCTDISDAVQPSLPASTFKIINLLIALETGVIKDENAVVRWPGHTDTMKYGYRPDIYHDMTVKEAFEVSAGWVFIELAKQVGRARYATYLQRCGYGNLDLSEPGDDFWNFGPMGISPQNQVEFLVKVYENKLPFSKRNLQILKRVMITENTANYTICSKTGWSRTHTTDNGWWVGYLEQGKEVYFFATRISKPRHDGNHRFGDCRKSITREILRTLEAL